MGDVIKFFQEQGSLVNLLLVGPVGSGKTTLKNLITTVMTSSAKRVNKREGMQYKTFNSKLILFTKLTAGVEGSGTWHTTNETIFSSVKQFTPREDSQKLKDVELRIIREMETILKFN